MWFHCSGHQATNASNERAQHVHLISSPLALFGTFLSVLHQCSSPSSVMMSHCHTHPPCFQWLRRLHNRPRNCEIAGRGCTKTYIWIYRSHPAAEGLDLGSADLCRGVARYFGSASCKSSLTDTQLGSNFNVIAYARFATPYTHLLARSTVSLTGLLGHISYEREESSGNR